MMTYIYCFYHVVFALLILQGRAFGMLMEFSLIFMYSI